MLLMSSAALGFDRSALQAVIAGCRLNATLTSSPFPCLKVEKPEDAPGGYALLREPGDQARTILTPLAPISGIEDPRLLDPGAANWFAKAWRERFSVARAFPAKDPWSDMALAINSQAGRT
jgi:CDP-diacylglycerol pyrophosphatase